MDVNQKRKYQESRYIVKKWESKFKITKGSVPTKDDIKAASKKVRDAYSTYWKLKADLLETSFLDATLDDNAKDCFTVAQVRSQGSEGEEPKVPVEEKSCSQIESTPPISFITLLSSAEKKPVLKDNNDSNKPKAEEKVQKTKELEKTESSVWGSHLSVKPQINSQVRSLKERSVSFQYTEKLFANAKFSKRNPRKSLRRNKTCDSLPVDTTCSVPAAAPVQDTASLTHPPSELIPSEHPVSSPLPPFSPFAGLSDSGSGHFDLLSEVKRVVIKEAPRVNYQGTGAVQALLRRNDGASPAPGNSNRVSRAVDMAWLGRVDSDSGIASSSAPLEEAEEVPSDDELICSDDESKSRFALNASNCGVWKQGVSKSLDQSLNRSNRSDGNSSFSDKGMVASTTNSLPVPRPLTLPFPQTNSLKPSLAVDSNSAGPPEIRVGALDKLNEEVGPSFKHGVQAPSDKVGTNSSLLVPNDALIEQSYNRGVGRGKRACPSDTGSSSCPTKKAKTDSAAKAATKQIMAKKQANLEKKVISGDANINFRRIDIQKKVFTRGKKGMNFSTYKKKQWKQLKGLDNKGMGIVKCFKCGDVGHMARQCKAVGDLLPYDEEAEIEVESMFPSLEEAAEAAAQQSVGMRVRRIPALCKPKSKPAKKSSADTVDQQEKGEECDEDWGLETDQEQTRPIVEPLYSLDPDEDSLPMGKAEVHEVLKELGYDSFLPGQEEGIMSVLCGRSCLVVLPTGSGKSLVYRLPALLYHRRRAGAIALVISPLVSLMEDQVSTSGEMKSSVGCLHHCQTEKQRKTVEEQVTEGKLSVLLVSPEMLSRDSALALVSKLPPISFACVDEAHCLSHWSHNFRPSYLSLCQLLRDRLGVKTLLGLTASVTASTVDGVMNALAGGPQQQRVHLVKSNRFVPTNLVLSVSQDEDRESALISLLMGSRFSSCNSLIVYCTRREQCVRIAALLRTNLRTSGEGTKSRLSPVAEVYHAGLTPARRKQVQKSFMTGKVRIVVATVAFGMGINKSDLRGVIHFNMPPTFENYLQEVGRAGRDGLPAHCHVFLSPAQSSDLWELKRHIYANSVDRCTLRRLIELARPECSGCERGRHEVAFPVDDAVQELDLTEEVISTLVSYLSSSGNLGFSLLSNAYTKARVSSYKGPLHLASLAKQCGVLGAGIAMSRSNGPKQKTGNTAEFDVVKLADSLAWDSGVVKRTLKNLEWIKSESEGGSTKWEKSGLHVELKELGVRLVSPCGLTPDQLDSALDLLHSKTTSHLETSLRQLHFLQNSLQAVAYKRVKDCCDDIDLVRCERLSSSIQLYFTDKSALDNISIKAKPVERESEVEATVRSLVSSGGSNDWTGRAVARILHGISSPRYPALIWASTPFWRRHLDQDFPSLLTLASLTLRRMK